MLQVMNDEFDVNVDDNSGEEIAAKIVGLRKLTLQGDFTMVDDMFSKWQERQSRDGDGKIKFQHVTRDDNEDDTDWDSDDSDEEDEEDGNDVEMRDAPASVKAPKEKPQPNIDEEGFTEVIGRKRR